jgi:hypothetical protein
MGFMNKLKSLIFALIIISSWLVIVPSFASDWYENLESLTPTKPVPLSGNTNKNISGDNVTISHYDTDNKDREFLQASNPLRAPQISNVSSNSSVPGIHAA